ncbi:MAG: AAA family ATPase, partial [Nocardioides sp.]
PVELKVKAAFGEDVEERIDILTQAVAALKANALATQLAASRREQRVLQQAADAASFLLAFDSNAYSDTLTRRASLAKDYGVFRTALFAAADLPAEPDDTWSDFIEAGDKYRQHLVEVDAHNDDRCLYCRQSLTDSASNLVVKYSTYLEDKISEDIRDTDARLAAWKRQAMSVKNAELASFIGEYDETEEKPAYFTSISTIEKARSVVSSSADLEIPVAPKALMAVNEAKAAVDVALATIDTQITTYETQALNRSKALEEKANELLELKDAAELATSWPLIETQIRNAKEADRLRTLKRVLPQLTRSVTELSKTASDELINQSFDTLFLEECEALRAPSLKVQFVGREGRAHRRKVLSGRHKPSKVLSEGEQKVLALADFLAEARLAGITAPVIFDDPVSSLDHRRVREVAQRIARLADDNQVIVFTHDILFATTLLALFEKSKRCTYYQVTDDGGKGQVSLASGPRWDTLDNFRKQINELIAAADKESGEAREALIIRSYSQIRSWCEIFVEKKLLHGVAERYRANVSMDRISGIKVVALQEAFDVVLPIYHDACRYIDGHSQPLVTLGVRPTLSDLQKHWAELQECQASYNKA